MGTPDVPAEHADASTSASDSQPPRGVLPRLTAERRTGWPGLTADSPDPYRTPRCSTSDWRWGQGRSGTPLDAPRPLSGGSTVVSPEAHWRRSTAPAEKHLRTLAHRAAPALRRD